MIDIDDLVDKLQALDILMRAGLRPGVVHAFGDGLIERVDNKGRFATARNAGNAGKGAEWNLDIDIVQIVGPRADHLYRLLLLAGAAFHRHCDLLHAGEIFSGQAVGRRHDRFRCAFGDDLAAMYSSCGTHIDDMIGGQDSVLVMFDDENRIAEVAQIL